MAIVGVVNFNLVAASNTDINSISLAEFNPIANWNNSVRELLAELSDRFNNSGTIAAAATVDLGTITQNYVTVTGTGGPITSFGTPTNKIDYYLRFTGAAMVTTSANLIWAGLSSAVTVTLAVGDFLHVKYEGTSVWRILWCRTSTGLFYGGDAATTGLFLKAQGAGVAPIWSALTVSYRALAIAGTIVAADNGGTINFTTAGVTATLTAAATLGSGFRVTISNTAASGLITIDPNGAETLDGQATRALSPGDRVTITCDGTNWITSSGEYTFTTPNQVATLSAVSTVAHGLGVIPKYVNMWLKCTTGANGYTAGDLIEVSASLLQSSNGDIACIVDATNIVIAVGNTGLSLVPKGGGARAALTTGNYAVVVRAVAN